MNVLFTLTYYSPYISGLTLYVRRIATGLSKKGNTCTILTMRYDKKLASKQQTDGVRIVRAEYLFKVSKGFISIDWIVKSFQQVRQHDVVVVNLPQVEGAITAVFARLLGRPVVSVYHCEMILPPSRLNMIIQFFVTCSSFITLFFSSSIITYTDDYAKNSKLLSMFASRINPFYPPVPIPKNYIRVQELFKDKIKNNPDIVIGIAARLASEKGVEYLFEAIPYLQKKLIKKTFKIVIAGPLDPVGEEKYREKIMRDVQRFSSHIVFLGAVKEEDMGSFYSLLDVLVLPSVNSTEAFGMVQVEAMMMGVPVVATNLPGVRIPIQKTGMGKIVEIRDSHAIANAITDIVTHREKYVLSRHVIYNIFSYKRTITAFLESLHTP